jgi:hypothetical protein
MRVVVPSHWGSESVITTVPSSGGTRWWRPRP